MPRGAPRHPERWASQAQSKRRSGWPKKLKSQGDHLCRADQKSKKNKKTPHMGFSDTVPWPQEENKQTHSSFVPCCHPLPLLWQVFIPQDKPEGQAAKDELQSAAFHSSGI